MIAQRGLEPVDQEASHFLADMDRSLADLAIKCQRTLDDRGAGVPAADHLNQRDHMRGTERMADDATLWMPAALGDIADQ
jgi:hypothetical protein